MKHGAKRNTTYQHAADRVTDIELKPLDVQGVYKAATNWARRHVNPLNPWRKLRTKAS